MKLPSGKHEFRLDENGDLICLRDGELFRDFIKHFIGDEPIYELYQYAETLENVVTFTTELLEFVNTKVNVVARKGVSLDDIRPFIQRLAEVEERVKKI